MLFGKKIISGENLIFKEDEQKLFFENREKVDLIIYKFVR
jgi:hypothetical protein